MAEKSKLTKAGQKKLQEELDNLVHVASIEVKKQLEEARAQGDLSENADYDAARDAQAKIESRIHEIENILKNAEIIDSGAKGSNKAALGSKVTIRYLETGKEFTFMIVGTVESNPFENQISNISPLGEALIGKSVDDIVDVKGKVVNKVQILKIETK